MNLDDMTLPQIENEIKKRGEEIDDLCHRIIHEKKAEPAPIQTAGKWEKINAKIDGIDYEAEVLS